MTAGQEYLMPMRLWLEEMLDELLKAYDELAAMAHGDPEVSPMQATLNAGVQDA